MEKKASILYLSYEGMTDSLGQSQVLSYMQKLSVLYEVTIVSFEKKDRFQQTGDQIRRICLTAGINWVPLLYTRTPPVLSTMYDVWQMGRKSRQLCREGRFRIVHCRSYITSIIGLQLRRKYGLKFIFDMRGFWVDEKVEAGYWNQKNPLYRAVTRFFRKKENQYYSQSDAVITLTHASAREIRRMQPQMDSKLYVIPTCVNLDMFRPFDPQTRGRIRHKMGIPADAFVLLYSGGFGANYDISFFLSVYKALTAVKDNVCILVLSKDGVTGFENEKEAGTIFSISLTYPEVGDYLMAGDLGVINYTNHFSVSARSPTKLGEYWACGLPAVAPPGVGDVDHLFSTYKGAGIIFNKDTFEDELNQLLPADKIKLREAAQAYFGLDNGATAYAGVYERLLYTSAGAVKPE